MSSASRVTSRRSVLAAVAMAAGGAGCVGAVGRNNKQPVSLLAAGSLQNALENGLRQAVAVPLETEARGSAEAARLVAEGQKDPDIVSLADIALFDAPLDAQWVAEFATNALVVAYNPATEGGRRLADADRWYEPLLDGAVSLGRTDPDLDPLGYRTLLMFDLATEYYDTGVDLRTAIPRRKQLYPENQLISQFETGALDAAIAYRNMAVERGYDFISLPAQIDLSDPGYADRYATVRYELPSGRVVSGGPISYGSTVRHRSTAVDEVFNTHVTGQYLHDFGFSIPDDYPRFTGNVPEAFTR